MEAVTLSLPRSSVCVTLPDETVYEGPVGTPLETFMLRARADHPELYPTPIIAAVVDGKLRELTYPLQRDCSVVPVMLNSPDGSRIYRRSLVLLLVAAVESQFPGVRVSVSYAVPEGGVYCSISGRAPFSDAELHQIETEMRRLVEDNVPIEKRIVPLEEAAALFKARGEADKVLLLEQRTRSELNLYTLGKREDYYYGYMVPSTGYLDRFCLTRVDGGFILQYPSADSPATITALTGTATKISRVFREEETWLRRIGVENIGTLNRMIRENEIQELILVAEARHEQQIARIAGEIYQRHHDQGVQLVLIAGPSSSGKTTFSKRLAIQLLAFGLRPFTLELDMYFVDRELTPRDEAGNYDFEALEAINLPLFNEQLLQLTSGKEVQLPVFDFKRGKSMAGPIGRLTDNQLLICEGIHGLNPALVTHIPNEKIFRIYVSPLTQLNMDSHNRIPSTDVRLLRRITRDAVQRGYSAADTIDRWESVRRGERRNIFPFQENADAIFNSTLVYELPVLKPLAEPLLLQVEYGTPAHVEANRLLLFMRWVQSFTPEQTALIPDTSLLREFIGGSILHDYQPGDLKTEDVIANGG
ncbi:MAG: nucleoside kinase [Candidatus Flexifilum sp.]|jgi:uridine kinase